MKIKPLIFLLGLFISFQASSTQQIKDSLDLGMAYFEIYELPLESHNDFKEIQKHFKSDGWCSANWRGYQASWSIVNGNLYLKSINISPCFGDDNFLSLKNLFNTNERNVFATWYTGNISFRISEITYFEKKIHGKSGTEYEAVVYNIENGKAISRDVKVIAKNW